MAAKTYIVYNGHQLTSSVAPTSITTSTSLKTLLQLQPGSATAIRVIEWGISFDGSAAATPGKVDLCDTGTVGATVTAYANADIFPFSDPNAAANASNLPLALSTTASGFTATAEGSITAIRELDVQLIAPTSQYVKQFPLGREPEIAAGNNLRIRVSFGTAINALCYVIFEV